MVKNSRKRKNPLDGLVLKTTGTLKYLIGRGIPFIIVKALESFDGQDQIRFTAAILKKDIGYENAYSKFSTSTSLTSTEILGPKNLYMETDLSNPELYIYTLEESEIEYVLDNINKYFLERKVGKIDRIYEVSFSAHYREVMDKYKPSEKRKGEEPKHLDEVTYA